MDHINRIPLLRLISQHPVFTWERSEIAVQFLASHFSFIYLSFVRFAFLTGVGNNASVYCFVVSGVRRCPAGGWLLVLSSFVGRNRGLRRRRRRRRWRHQQRTERLQLRHRPRRQLVRIVRFKCWRCVRALQSPSETNPTGGSSLKWINLFAFPVQRRRRKHQRPKGAERGF